MGTYRKIIPRVYVSPSSPPSVAVMLAIKHLGIEVDFIEVTMANNEHLSPQFLKVNPQHSLPTLDDNGYILTDSHVIMAYLVEMYGKDDSLYPSSQPKLKAMVDQRLHFHTGTIQARAVYIFANHHMQCCQFHKYFAQEVFKLSSDTPERDTELMIDAYSTLDKFVINQQFMASNFLTIADLVIICSLLNTSLLVPIDPVRFPNLTKWINLMKSLPHHEVIEIGLEDMKSLLHFQ